MAHSLASCIHRFITTQPRPPFTCVHGCFQATTAELRRQYADPAVHKAENISYLSIYRKRLLIPTLEG